MTPPPSELRAEELFQLSQTSLAAISGSGFTDPDPPVTPLVLEGMLASTNISVSILIDSGASLDAVSHNFAREHVLTMLPLKQSSAAVLPNGAKIALSQKCRVPLRLASTLFTYVNAFVLPLTAYDIILGLPFLKRHNALLNICDRSLSLQTGNVTQVLTEPAASYQHNSLAGIAGTSKRSHPGTEVLQNQRAAIPISPQSSAAHHHVVSSPTLDICSATIPGNDALSRRQWNREVRCHTISKDDVFVFTLSPDSEHFSISDCNANLLGTISRAPTHGPAISAMSTDSNDMTATILNYIEENRVRLEAEGADVPDRLRELLLQYSSQFKSFPDTLPELDPELLQRIHLTDGPPPASRPYRLSPSQLAACKEQLDKLLSAGLIRNAASPFSAPVLMVPKPGGKWRLTVDYRALNARMKRDSFPLPHPADIFNELAGHKYFSRMDLASGFWQIRIDPCDEDKTAFVAASLGQYAWKVLPMGLCTAPSVFARLMQKVLKSLLGVCATTYLDDIGLYADTVTAHLARIGQTLEALKQQGLFANFSKCAFLLRRMEFLGHIVSETGIEVDPSKVSAIADWPCPSNVSQLRSFLGLINYYREYIENFAHRAGALTLLLSATVPFEWGPSQEQAFADLKAAVTSAPVLQPFRTNAQHLVMADASSVGLGAVLLQADTDNDLFRPVASHSRKLSPAERNYPTREQELLDALSRRYDDIEPEPAPAFSSHLWPDLSSIEKDLPSEPRTLHAMSAVHNSFCDQVRAAQLSDPNCIALCQKLDSVPLSDPIRKTYRISDDQLLETMQQSKHRVVVPFTAMALRNQLLQEAHDTNYAAHLGTDKTYQRLSERWYWKSMWNDTHKFVRSCHTCIGNKASNQQPMGEARPLPLPSKP